MNKRILCIAVAIAGSCGPNGGSEFAASNKGQPIRNGFLVDMALTPAPEGKCPEGGVTQNYYYDLNGNGEFDSGEDHGLVSALDCYSGVVAATNPCEIKGGKKCEKPTKSNQPILKDCKDATNEQKLTASFILNDNGKKGVPLENACSQLFELSKSMTDTDVIIHFGKQLSFDDYSIVPIMANIRDIYLDGAGSAMKDIRNIDALKALSNRMLGELWLINMDFTEISFLDFLPQKGAKFVQINGSNLAGFNRLASWSYSSKTPIKDIVESTKILTTGPKF